MLSWPFAIIFSLILAQTAQAGPWLREKGASFTSASVTSTYYLDTASQTYLEYGLTEETTVVADIGMFRYRYGWHSGYANFSIRRALGPKDATSKWAYELGVNASWVGETVLPHLRTGLSWGRGITIAQKSGWMTAEASVIWDLTHASHLAKVDSTLGVNFSDTAAGMMQIYIAHLDQHTFTTIAPSIILSPKISKFRIQIGTESELGNLRNSAFKIGLWREF